MNVVSIVKHLPHENSLLLVISVCLWNIVDLPKVMIYYCIYYEEIVRISSFDGWWKLTSSVWLKSEMRPSNVKFYYGKCFVWSIFTSVQQGC